MFCESRQFSILGQNFLLNGQICGRFFSRQHKNSCRSTRRASATNKHQGGCSQVKGKVKAKPQTRVLVGTTATIPIHERRWIDIEPSKQNLASYDLSKKVINLLRHNQTLQREEDGAIEFYKIKFYLRNQHSQIQNWSDDRWKACLAAGGGSKRRYQYCSDDSGTILYLRALQGHSGSNLIDPTLQDNVVIGTGIFNYTTTLDVHSIFIL